VSARVEQAKWAVVVLMRDYPPARLDLPEPRRFRRELFDLDAALSGFSQAIEHATAEERFVAVEALVWLRERRAISPLIRGLRDAEWDIRHAAAVGLASFEPLPEWALERLADATTTDAEPCVRAAAAEALGGLFDHRALATVTAALDDPARAVRSAALRAIAALGRGAITDAEARARLAHLIAEDPDAFLVRAALTALIEQRGVELHQAWRRAIDDGG
jgi:HEAT repeat protein